MSEHDHVVSVKIYFAVFAALMAATALTVWVAYIDLGDWSPAIAITIAMGKALLVVLYFMHVRYGGRLIGVVVAAGLVWLLILLGLTLSDYLTRVPFLPGAG